MALRRTRSTLRVADEIQNADGTLSPITSIDEILDGPPAAEMPHLPNVPVVESDSLER